MSTAEVIYAIEPDLSVEEYADVLLRSTLAERRPIDQPEILSQMLAGADLLITARVGGLLVGISRAVTDFAYCVYLSDLAVDVAHQRRGIGRELIRRTKEAAGPHAMLILLAAPKAVTYYPHIGMKPYHSCWVIEREPFSGPR